MDQQSDIPALRIDSKHLALMLQAGMCSKNSTQFLFEIAGFTVLAFWVEIGFLGRESFEENSPIKTSIVGYAKFERCRLHGENGVATYQLSKIRSPDGPPPEGLVSLQGSLCPLAWNLASKPSFRLTGYQP